MSLRENKNVEFGKEEILRRLSLFDEAISEYYSKRKLKLILIGGAAVILNSYHERVTRDIDVDRMEYDIEQIALDFAINCNNLKVAIYPLGYKDRLIELVEYNVLFKHLILFSVSDADLILLKLQRSSDKDINDLIESGAIIKCDRNTLYKEGERLFETVSMLCKDNWTWFKNNYLKEFLLEDQIKEWVKIHFEQVPIELHEKYGDSRETIAANYFNNRLGLYCINKNQKEAIDFIKAEINMKGKT